MHQTLHSPQVFSDGLPLYQIRSLSYRYPDGQPALNGIDLTINQGDRIALVGHNGAGKTTFIKHLNALYSPQQGSIHYKGKLLEGKYLEEVRLKAGILFQDPDDQLFSNTIYEDMAFGPLNQGLSQEEVDRRVRHAARTVGIEKILFKAPHHLSYGQKRRAALATILSLSPEVLILDEPTANLDSKQERLFWELLQDFPGTLIVISHDLAFVYGICERAVVLERGRIHHDYSMRDLVTQGVYLRSHGLDFTFRFSCCQDHHHDGPHSADHGDHAHHSHVHSHDHDADAPAQDTGGCPAPSHLLCLKDYSYRYPDGSWGIQDVSLEVKEGESVAVVGENGAGKSTLARCLMGILAGKGRHDFKGRPIDRRNRNDLWRHMGMVFQNPSDQLFCPSCREEVAFGPKQLGLPQDEIDLRVAEALASVRLTGYEDRVPHHLSGGERKRLAIASVLSMRPGILILDEPTAHLDPQGEELLVEILRKLKVTKILISHDMPLIQALCRRTIVLHEGRIIRDYPTKNFEHDEGLVSINGLDYTYKNHCHREIFALQNGFDTRENPVGRPHRLRAAQ